MIELMQKLRGVLDIAGEGLAPEGLLARALERMEEGHYRAAAKAAHSSGGQDCRGPMWEDVKYLEAAEEEAADWVNYVSGMVGKGEMTVWQGITVVREIGQAWRMMRAFAASGG